MPRRRRFYKRRRFRGRRRRRFTRPMFPEKYATKHYHRMFYDVTPSTTLPAGGFYHYVMPCNVAMPLTSAQWHQSGEAYVYEGTDPPVGLMPLKLFQLSELYNSYCVMAVKYVMYFQPHFSIGQTSGDDFHAPLQLIVGIMGPASGDNDDDINTSVEYLNSLSNEGLLMLPNFRRKIVRNGYTKNTVKFTFFRKTSPMVGLANPNDRFEGLRCAVPHRTVLVNNEVAYEGMTQPLGDRVFFLYLRVIPSNRNQIVTYTLSETMVQYVQYSDRIRTRPETYLGLAGDEDDVMGQHGEGDSDVDETDLTTDGAPATPPDE